MNGRPDSLAAAAAGNVAQTSIGCAVGDCWLAVDDGELLAPDEAGAELAAVVDDPLAPDDEPQPTSATAEKLMAKAPRTCRRESLPLTRRV